MARSPLSSRPPGAVLLHWLVAGLGLAAAGSASAQDRTVLFGTKDAGVSKKIPSWGLDTAWPSYDNMRRGVFFMGQDQVDLVRVVFPVNSQLNNGELTTAQLNDVAYRVSLANLAGTNKSMTMTADTGAGVDAWYKNGSEVVPARWVQAMEATVRAYAAQGRTIVSAAPFNEPDYGWDQGTIANLYDICGLLGSSATFSGISLAGGSTLNCDWANTWYDPIKSRVQEGTTHQLGGSFNSYAGFYQNVIASGDRPVNEEVHSLVEVIAGAEYGLQSAIWWGTAELARGGFVRASDGVRLGYAEHRPQFTAAAVYRGPGGAVQAFLGSSERQGQTSIYRFFNRDRKVFYDGQGPRHDYSVTINNAQDRVVNITWGADVPPPLNGRYVVVNRNSGKVLEVAGGSTADGVSLQQNTYAGVSSQQWDVTPYSNAWGDQSFYSLRAAHSGKAADVNNFSYDNGARVQQWSDLSGDNQKWYFEYAGDGWFYIRSRWSGRCLEVAGSSTANGAAVWQWAVGPAGLNQQWRFLPVGAAVEFTAPSVPTGLAAAANPVSVRLSWDPVSAADLAGYTVLRSETSGSGYEIIARDLAAAAWVDDSAKPGHTYYYVIRAVDRSLNRSALSAPVAATPTGVPALVAHYSFDGHALDGAENGNDAEPTDTATYGAGRIGAGALALDGSGKHVNLPAGLVQYDQLTVAAWVFWNGGAAWQRLFDFGNGTDQYLFLTPAAAGAGLRFAIKNGGAEQQLNAAVLPSGQWVHLAVTLGGGSARLYVNGVAAASGSVTIKPSDFNPVLNYIGDSQFDADPGFNGLVDEFRVYNQVLTASDVAALAAGLPPAPGNVVATPGPLEIGLSWAAVPYATGYAVRYATASGGPYSVLSTGLTATGYTHAGLSFGQTYYYTVEATTPAGTGPASAPLGATPEPASITDTERAAARIAIVVGADQSSSATLSIQASVAGHTYQVQYTDDLLEQWIDLGSPQAGTGADLLLTLPTMPPASRAFYRVLIQR